MKKPIRTNDETLQYHLEVCKYSAYSPTEGEKFQIHLSATDEYYTNADGKSCFTLPEVYRETEKLFGTQRATSILARCTIQSVGEFR